MAFFDKEFKEIFSSEVISVLGGLLVGVFLAIYTDKLLLIPGMLILLPGFLEMRGNISGSLASRISSGLFLKVISPKDYKSKIVSGNVIAATLLAIMVSLFLGLLAFTFDYLVLHKVVIEIIFIPLIAGIIANAIEIVVTLAATFYLFKKGHDPNNIMGPFVTTTGDVTSTLALLFAILII